MVRNRTTRGARGSPAVVWNSSLTEHERRRQDGRRYDPFDDHHHAS